MLGLDGSEAEPRGIRAYIVPAWTTTLSTASLSSTNKGAGESTHIAQLPDFGPGVVEIFRQYL